MHGDDRFALVRFEAAGAFSGSTESDDRITVAAATGRLDWEVGDERGTSADVFLPNTDGMTFAHFGPMIMVSAFVKRARVTELGRARYGVDDLPLRFDGSRPVSVAHGDRIAALLRYADQIGETPVFDDEVVRSLILRRLSIGILESYRLRGDREILARGQADRARRYRAAVRVIEEEAATAITPEDVALAVGLGSRELDDIFRGHSSGGADVMQSIARARLEVVHRSLQAADPLRETVRAIAASYGFTNPSRFNVLYQRAYGTTPGRTLRG